MRESCTSGSERGKPRKGLTYLPVPYIISVKLELDSVWNGGVQVFLGILGIAGGFVATAITGKFQIKNI